MGEESLPEIVGSVAEVISSPAVKRWKDNYEEVVRSPVNVFIGPSASACKARGDIHWYDPDKEYELRCENGAFGGLQTNIHKWGVAAIAWFPQSKQILPQVGTRLTCTRWIGHG